MSRRSATLLVATALCAFGSACASLDPAPDIFAPGAVLPTVGAAAIALQHDDDLRLTDDQRSVLQRIQRSVDSTNAPLRQRLDSLRPTHRPVNPNDLSREQREEIDARRKTAHGILEQMRQNAEPYRARTLAVLTAEQQAKLADYEADERRRDAAPPPQGG